MPPDEPSANVPNNPEAKATIQQRIIAAIDRQMAISQTLKAVKGRLRGGFKP